MTSVLEVRKLRKVFPIRTGAFRRKMGEFVAVDDVSFKVMPQEIVGLVGESGSGKSTLARASIRLIPAEGEIVFGGVRLDELSSQELLKMRPRAQMVFQDPSQSLNPRKTILQTLSEPLLYHKRIATAKEAIPFVADLLVRVGLTPDVMDRYPHEFSGGQQQRLCIGRAIGLKPELIICDEAVSALDLSVRSQILNLLLDLKAESPLSILFISHDLAVVRAICDRVLVMHQGKIVEEGPTEELFRSACHPYTKRLLAAILPSYPR